MLNAIWNFLSLRKPPPPPPPPNLPLFTQIQFQSNNPCQDRICSGTIPSLNIHYLGVFDGHGGPKVSSFLSDNIHKILHQEFSKSSISISNNQNYIKNSLEKIFEILEKRVLQVIHFEALQKNPATPQYANSGSCILLAVVTERYVYVANAGDSQGVVINADPEETYITNKINNTSEEDEVKKLMKMFPKDEHLFETINGTLYIKGKLMVTRCIGDFSLKYKKPNKKMISALENPYISCKPVISCYEIREGDEFVLLATDGLWELLSVQEVQEIVKKSVEGREGKEKQKCKKKEKENNKNKNKGDYEEKEEQVNGLKPLINECCRKCVVRHNIHHEKLIEMENTNRRMYIDDISVVMFDLKRRKGRE